MLTRNLSDRTHSLRCWRPRSRRRTRCSSFYPLWKRPHQVRAHSRNQDEHRILEPCPLPPRFLLGSYRASSSDEARQMGLSRFLEEFASFKEFGVFFLSTAITK